jgi:hypothetical protein
MVANYSLGVGPVVTLSGTSPTLNASHRGKYCRTSSSSAVALNVPKNSDVNIPVNSVINVCAGGSGTVTVTPASGVTINSPGGLLAIAAQYGLISLVKIGEDEWDLAGNLA